jgi:putative PIN family toxin of toxin-antitoxin system
MPIGDLARIVVDTNVLISAALLPRSMSARALEHALENFQLVQSADTLAELVDVIMRPKFAHYLDDEKRSHFLFVMAQVSELIAVQTRVTECIDQKDNKFLELAIDANARVIVSGDSHLLDLHPFRGIAVVAPADFIAQGLRDT